MHPETKSPNFTIFWGFKYSTRKIEQPQKFLLSFSASAMAAEEEKGTQRQRFYIELKPGKTTIVSWKKLLREANPMDQSVATSTACETSRRTLDDSLFRDTRVKHVNRATSSGYKQPRKRRIDVSKMEDQKNDGHSSIKHAGPVNMCEKATAKAIDLFDETFRHTTSPAVIKDNPPKEAVKVDVPILTYSKKSSSFSSKYKSPPLTAVEDVSVFPLKIMHDVLPKTEKISSEKSRMKVGVGGESSDVMHQNFEGRCVPVKINPTSGMLLHDKDSSKSRQYDKSSGSRKLIDAITPSYRSSSKDSKDFLASVNNTSLVRPFGKVLETAIGELEDAVAKTTSCHFEALDAHASWLVIERELPPEVMLKLGSVASIVRSGKEIVSEELVNRLVSILGKLVHGKKFKRTLRKVVMLKLFMRKDKAEKFEGIRNEIISMVSDQQVKAAHIREVKNEQMSSEAYKLDDTMEDKLCDLYELCFQGVPGDKNVEVQKLFIELADIWPKGVMDHYKLTEAISRAKSRRAVAVKNLGQNVVDNVKRNPDRTPCEKSKVTVSSDNYNPNPSLPRKTVPKKAAAIEQPVLKHKSSHPLTKGVKLSFKQKQFVPEKTNVKVKFLLKPKHETAKANEEASKDTSNHSRVAVASLTSKQPT